MQWAFGSNMGFCGNAKYLFLYLCQHQEYGIKVIWIGDKIEVDNISALGLPACCRWSFNGVWSALRSGVYLYNSYVSDVNIHTRGRAVKVNLWHGVGIKNIERKITIGPVARMFRSYNPIVRLKANAMHIKPDIFLSTSPMMTNHFSECFGISPNQCIESIYPRCSIFNMSKDQLSDFIELFESEASKTVIQLMNNYENAYFYMPTWRDEGDNFFNTYHINFGRLNESLKTSNSLLIVKLHPVSKVDNISEDLSNVLFIDKNIDVYPLLPFTTGLITDYSSIYFDYILLNNKKIILFIPDFERYITHDRDLAFPYKEFTRGHYVYDVNELANCFKSPSSISKDGKLRNVVNAFWSDTQGSCDKLIKQILNKIDLIKNPQ